MALCIKMFSQRLPASYLRNVAKSFRTSPVKYEQNVSKSSESKKSAETPYGHQVTDFQKRILVWTGFYPSVDQVPASVSHTRMDKAFQMFRVRFSIALLLVGAVGALSACLVGKGEASRLEQMRNEIKKKN